MDIFVQVELQTALALHQQRSTPNSEALCHIVSDLGVTLEPLHLGKTERHLMPYFIIRTASRDVAAQIVARLQACSEVEAVYLKPQDQLS